MIACFFFLQIHTKQHRDKTFSQSTHPSKKKPKTFCRTFLCTVRLQKKRAKKCKHVQMEQQKTKMQKKKIKKKKKKNYL